MMQDRVDAVLELYDRARPLLGWFLLVGIISVPAGTLIFRESSQPQVEPRIGTVMIQGGSIETTLKVDVGFVPELGEGTGLVDQYDGPRGPSGEELSVTSEQRRTTAGETGSQKPRGGQVATGTRSDVARDTQPASNLDSQPASSRGAQPASSVDSQPASSRGAQPASNLDSQPASEGPSQVVDNTPSTTSQSAPTTESKSLTTKRSTSTTQPQPQITVPSDQTTKPELDEQVPSSNSAPTVTAPNITETEID